MIFELKITSSSELLVSDKCLTDFRNSILKAHNYFRLLHYSPSLYMYHSLNSIAEKHAHILAQKDILKHNNLTDLGENLALIHLNKTPNLIDCSCNQFINWIN